MAADKNINILVVDDSGAILKQLQEMLIRLGFKNIDTATDGMGALARISVKNYGLVISDWNMEPMSGLDLLKDIRRRSFMMPFIMITSQCTVERKLEAFSVGATDFLIKPFSEVELGGSLFWALSKTSPASDKKSY